MNNFIYDIPVKVYFGEGQLSHLGEELRKYGRRVLLTYGGGSIKRIGLYDRVIEELRIPQEDAVSPISYAGMSVQEIDWIKSREDVADYMECSWLVIDDEEYDD